MTYDPMIYMSDFWNLERDLVMFNDTVTNSTVRLHFQPYSLWSFVMQKQFAEQENMQNEWGMDSNLNEMKRMYLETNIILLTVTGIVSLLHTLFEMLAFKNDISFWKEKDSMEGISVKTLYLQFGCSIIILLYLCDNETSFMILGP
mmetsp:Transcript_4432/g.5765  ORF Transcript_4432/g.5765 Transcript_4432/m.5765 type:complete len:146 (+) Transcript_4432:851-1288(+)